MEGVGGVVFDLEVGGSEVCDRDDGESEARKRRGK